jgi:hypothetical protein
VQTPVRARRSGAPLARRVLGVGLALIGCAAVAWSLVAGRGTTAASFLVPAGAVLAAAGLALAVSQRSPRGVATPREADAARAGAVLEEPMSETELRTRIAVLADVAAAQDAVLALVLVAPAEPHAGTPGEQVDRLLVALGEQSRGDDLRAELPDAAGVLLPSVTGDEACGYAVRVASALTRGTDTPAVCVGVALTGSDAYPAAALLRRGRRALATARATGPGAVIVSDPAGTRPVDRRSLAARPTVGRRARR